MDLASVMRVSRHKLHCIDSAAGPSRRPTNVHWTPSSLQTHLQPTCGHQNWPHRATASIGDEQSATRESVGEELTTPIALEAFSNASETSNVDDDEARAMALALARVCWETKGEDVMVLHVAPLVFWTRYMILVTVFSRPQLGAMLAKLEKEAEEHFGRRPAAPATGRSTWELLDYGDIVCHVLTAEEREYYDLVSAYSFILLLLRVLDGKLLFNTDLSFVCIMQESFYGAAEEVDLPFLEGEQTQPSWQTKL